jgi:hypothetical protein
MARSGSQKRPRDSAADQRPFEAQTCRKAGRAAEVLSNPDGAMLDRAGRSDGCRPPFRYANTKEHQMSDEIKVKIEGRPAAYVPKAAYVKAKTKQLREFGYGGLKETEVEDQLALVMAGKKIGSGLNVIGGFMVDEIIVPEQPAEAAQVPKAKKKLKKS